MTIRDLFSVCCPKCGSKLRKPPLAMEIIDAYIKREMADYIEPTRRGTPKGEAVGYSRTKYKATLLALRQSRVTKQAEELNVRYTVLLTWRAQPEFQRKVSVHLERIAALHETAVRRSEIPTELVRRHGKPVKVRGYS